MELMRMRPFGKRKKTYFYAVAGFVLAAHVVVGKIFHVMPPEFDEPGTIIPVEVQFVDHLLPDDVVESSAVRMVDDPVDLEGLEEEELLPIFPPLWEASPTAPDAEPIGPTESVLPDLVIEVPDIEPELPAVKPDVPAVTKEPTPTKLPTKPVPTTKEPPVKPMPAPVRAQPTKRSSTPPVRKPVEAKKRPEPLPEPEIEPAPEIEPEPLIERAIPVAPRSGGRTGMLNRLRNKPSQGSRSEPYVAASWSKRPPPYYPHEARKRSIEGTAHVRVSIDSKGRITASRIVRSAGNALLDQAALASVKKGVLSPATRGGRAVASEMLVPFEFYLP